MEEPTSGGTIWAAAASDVGLVRSRNEDGVWLGDNFLRTGHGSVSLDAAAVRRGVFLAVADGVGGAAAGDVASRFVLEEMASFIDDAPHPLMPESAGPWMQQAAAAVNDQLAARGESRDELRGMATTLTGIYFQGPLACWINAGDSRLYALRGGSLTQISRDHTLREMTGDPQIPGNIITNCFGTQNEFYLDVGELLPADDLTYLLCSDGLSDYTEHATLDSIVKECAMPQSLADLDAAAARLVTAAKAGGGGDNITCMVVRHRGTCSGE